MRLIESIEKSKKAKNLVNASTLLHTKSYGLINKKLAETPKITLDVSSAAIQNIGNYFIKLFISS